MIKMLIYLFLNLFNLILNIFVIKINMQHQEQYVSEGDDDSSSGQQPPPSGAHELDQAEERSFNISGMHSVTKKRP